MTDSSSSNPDIYCPCGVLEATDHGCEITYRKAKAEIERLTRERDEAQRDYDCWYLRQERDRLRAALTWYAGQLGQSKSHDMRVWVQDGGQRARAALSGEPAAVTSGPTTVGHDETDVRSAHETAALPVHERLRRVALELSRIAGLEPRFANEGTLAAWASRLLSLADHMALGESPSKASERLQDSSQHHHQSPPGSVQDSAPTAPAAPGRPNCGEELDKYICTLSAGHAGQHEAWGTRGNLIREWPSKNGGR